MLLQVRIVSTYCSTSVILPTCHTLLLNTRIPLPFNTQQWWWRILLGLNCVLLFPPGASYPGFTAGRLTLHRSCISSCYFRGQGEIKSTSILNRSYLNLHTEWKSKPVVTRNIHDECASHAALGRPPEIFQGSIGNWSVWVARIFPNSKGSMLAPCFPSIRFLAFENWPGHTGQVRHSAHRHAPGSSIVAFALAAALCAPLCACPRRSLPGSPLAIPHREAGPHAGGSHNTNKCGCTHAGPNQNGSHNLNQFGCYEVTQCATCQRILCICSRSVTSQLKYESSLAQWWWVWQRLDFQFQVD